MKKLIIFMLALGFSSTIFAQLPAFCIGPKIGYNTTKLSTDASSISSDLKSNFQFGAFVRIGDKIYIQPEVNYVTKGGVLKKENTPDQEVTLKTLTIPLLLGVKVIDLKVASIHLVGGPVASFALNKKLSMTDPGSSWPVNSIDDIKNSAWSLQAGAGVDVLMFTLDIRYELGLSNMSKVPDFSLKNNLFNVSLGLKLL
jgi:hypothetical protein